MMRTNFPKIIPAKSDSAYEDSRKATLNNISLFRLYEGHESVYEYRKFANLICFERFISNYFACQVMKCFICFSICFFSLEDPLLTFSEDFVLSLTHESKIKKETVLSIVCFVVPQK